MYAGRFTCHCARQEAADALLPPEQRRKQGPNNQYGWEKQRGCEEDTESPIGWFDMQPLTRCVAKIVPVWCWEVLRLWPHWQNGTMPGPGGVLQQPATLIDAMEIVTATMNEIDANTQQPTPSAAPGKPAPGGFQARSPVRSSIKRGKVRRR